MTTSAQRREEERALKAMQRAIDGDDEAFEVLQGLLKRSHRLARIVAEEAVRNARLWRTSPADFVGSEGISGRRSPQHFLSVVCQEQLLAACRTGAEWAWLETPSGRQVPALLLCPTNPAQLDRWVKAPNGLPPVMIQAQVVVYFGRAKGPLLSDKQSARLLRLIIVVKDGDGPGWARDTFFDVRDKLYRTEDALRQILDSGELLIALADRRKAVLPLTTLWLKRLRDRIPSGSPDGEGYEIDLTLGSGHVIAKLREGYWEPSLARRTISYVRRTFGIRTVDRTEGWDPAYMIAYKTILNEPPLSRKAVSHCQGRCKTDPLGPIGN